MGADPLIDIVDRLLERSRPGGIPHKKLLKYRDQLARNVMLGPSSRRFISELVRHLDDKIECRHLSAIGICRKKRLACDKLEDNAKCGGYSPARPQRKGNPLGRQS